MIRGVYQCPLPRGAEKVHRAQKPVEVLRWLLSIPEDREGLVVDPLAGSTCRSRLGSSGLSESWRDVVR